MEATEAWLNASFGGTDKLSLLELVKIQAQVLVPGRSDRPAVLSRCLRAVSIRRLSSRKPRPSEGVVPLLLVEVLERRRQGRWCSPPLGSEALCVVHQNVYRRKRRNGLCDHGEHVVPPTHVAGDAERSAALCLHLLDDGVDRELRARGNHHFRPLTRIGDGDAAADPAGKLKAPVDVVAGFEELPAALAGMFAGKNRGKLMVRVCTVD